MDIGDKVFIRIPAQTGGLILKGMKKYNNKVATIIGIEGDKYKINLDDGKNHWPSGVLGLIIRS